MQNIKFVFYGVKMKILFFIFIVILVIGEIMNYLKSYSFKRNDNDIRKNKRKQRINSILDK